MIFDDICESVTGMMKQIHELPFNVELGKGILPKEKFIFYLIQDVIYLADFSRALAITAAKLTDTQMTRQLIEFSQQAIIAERDLHINYIQAHPSGSLLSREPTPACFMYTNYLLNIASTATAEEAVASLLPCFYVYREVGKKMALYCYPQNPYQDWINIYSGKEFNLSVQIAIDIVNKLGERTSPYIKEKMLKAFVRSTQLEWLFWHSAYHQERWLV